MTTVVPPLEIDEFFWLGLGDITDSDLKIRVALFISRSQGIVAKVAELLDERNFDQLHISAQGAKGNNRIVYLVRNWETEDKRVKFLIQRSRGNVLANLICRRMIQEREGSHSEPERRMRQ